MYSRPSNAGIFPRNSERSSPKTRLWPPTAGIRRIWEELREWEKGEEFFPPVPEFFRNFPHLFLPTVSWSLTTTVSSASGSSGIPFRSHSNPWKKWEEGAGISAWKWRTQIPNPLGITAFPKPKFPANPPGKDALGKAFPWLWIPGKELLQPQSVPVFPPNSLFFWNFGTREHKDKVRRENVLGKFPFHRNSL